MLYLDFSIVFSFDRGDCLKAQIHNVSSYFEFYIKSPEVMSAEIYRIICRPSAEFMFSEKFPCLTTS